MSPERELLFLGSGDGESTAERPPKTLENYLQEAASDLSVDSETLELTPRANISHAYKVGVTPVPGPYQRCWHILHVTVRRRPKLRVQLSMIEELSRQIAEDANLNEAGQYLADRLHHHLGVNIAVRWGQEGEEWGRWESGDPAVTKELMPTANQALSSRGDGNHTHSTTVHHRRGSQEFPVTEVSLRSESGQVLMLRLGPAEAITELDVTFWKFFGAMARSFLQSAHTVEAHRRERQRLRTVLESMPMAVVLFDDDGEIYDWNTRAQMMMGRQKWRRLGSDNHPFIICDTDGNPLPKEEWPFIRAVQTKTGYDEELFVLDFGEYTRTVSLSVIPIFDRGGDEPSTYLGTARDVTQRTEEDRRKDEFLSVASHELRSPLTPLAGFIQMSRKQAAAGRPVDPEILRRAEDQIERLQRLIDGLLDVTRLETGKLPIQRSEVDLCTLVERVIAPWLQGPEAHRVSLTVPPSPLMAAVDPDRIDQVLTNVVANAFEHGRRDGSVDITLKKQEDKALLQVRDEGDGIPSEILDRVFDRYFFSHHEEASGTGLGLYLARQIIEDHQGSITIDSGRGQPTTVSICLPLEV